MILIEISLLDADSSLKIILHHESLATTILKRILREVTIGRHVDQQRIAA